MKVSYEKEINEEKGKTLEREKCRIWKGQKGKSASDKAFHPVTTEISQWKSVREQKEMKSKRKRWKGKKSRISKGEKAKNETDKASYLVTAEITVNENQL